jgi:ribosomal protein L31
LIVYHNPVKGSVLTIKIANAKPFFVGMIECTGKLCMCKTIEENAAAIDVSSLFHGVYTIQNKAGQKMLVRQFVKN